MMRRAFTFTELLVVFLVVLVALCALMPTMARVRADSGQIASVANLQLLSFGHVMYAPDWNDRQVTYVPDDMGLLEGNPALYAAYVGCPGQQILGFDINGASWGYYLPCAAAGGLWGNFAAYTPNTWGSNVFGGFRVANSKAFSSYVDGRFYSPAFYAPNDTITYQIAQPAFDFPGEFTVGPGGPVHPETGAFNHVLSSYVLSPASMWLPKVLSQSAESGLWWTPPNTLPLGYQSPTVSQCTHPDLKTRMIEHNWNAGQPGPVNPAFNGGITPYYFSHGIDAAPITLFFDGHVEELPNAQVAADDAKVLAATGGAVGLWTRDTPLGTDGYFGAQSYDGFKTGHHVLTADGIHGRDVLYAGPPRQGGIAERGLRDRRRRPTPMLPIDPPGSEFLPQPMQTD